METENVLPASCSASGSKAKKKKGDLNFCALQFGEFLSAVETALLKTRKEVHPSAAYLRGITNCLRKPQEIEDTLVELVFNRTMAALQPVKAKDVYCSVTYRLRQDSSYKAQVFEMIAKNDENIQPNSISPSKNFVIQCFLRRFFEALLIHTLSLSVNHHEVTVPFTDPELNDSEQDALMYISGYIIKRILSKVKKSPSTYEIFYKNAVGVNNNQWINAVSRGGLITPTTDAFTLFREMYRIAVPLYAVNTHTRRTDRKSVAQKAILDNPTIINIWATLVGGENSKYLIFATDIMLTIMGNILAKNLKEKFKLTKKAALKFVKGLRKRLKD